MSIMRIIALIKSHLGMDRHASERDLLQTQIYALHPHSRRLDRKHRQEIQRNVYLYWPITEVELKRGVNSNGVADAANAELPQTL